MRKTGGLSIANRTNRTNKMARAQRLAGEIKIQPYKKPLNLDILDQNGFATSRSNRMSEDFFGSNRAYQPLSNRMSQSNINRLSQPVMNRISG